MLALALVVHLVAAAPAGAPAASPGPHETAPAAVDAPEARAVTASTSPPPSAADEGTGSASPLDPLGARPSLALPPSSRTSLVPRLRGPFGGAELAMAGLGTLAGDALVLGLGYGVLRLFANGTIDPNAENFRRAAFAMAGAALVVPPLLAVLAARLVAGRHGGSIWKGLLLATAGHALALAAGYWASPHLWAFVPAQVAALSMGASVGLHWGPRGPREPMGHGAPRDEGAPPPPPLALAGVCPVSG